MFFGHAEDVFRDFPALRVGAIAVSGIGAGVDVSERVAPFHARALERLADMQEGEFPEIQAWRRAFSKLGLKPTQYRCASEALLRRLRQEGSLPSIHPVVDLCNALSAAYAIPIAALDADRVGSELQVRRATGAESYLAFNGETEHPEPCEIAFVDNSGRAHARRWTNRQSLYSAMRPETKNVLIVCEALHESAGEDMTRLVADLTAELKAVWDGPVVRSVVYDGPGTRFAFGQA
jgi:Uncharacterized conserved protein